MSLVQSKKERDKILAERPEFSNLSILLGLALVPMGLFIITTIIWLIKSPSSYLQALPNILRLLVTLTLIFGVLGVFALRRVHSALMDATKKPILLTIGLFTNAAIFIFFVKPPFTEVEISEFKKYWWVYALAWSLFPRL